MMIRILTWLVGVALMAAAVSPAKARARCEDCPVPMVWSGVWQTSQLDAILQVQEVTGGSGVYEVVLIRRADGAKVAQGVGIAEHRSNTLRVQLRFENGQWVQVRFAPTETGTKNLTSQRKLEIREWQTP